MSVWDEKDEPDFPEPIHTVRELLEQTKKGYVLIADGGDKSYFAHSDLHYAYSQAMRLIRSIESIWDRQDDASGEGGESS